MVPWFPLRNVGDGGQGCRAGPAEPDRPQRAVAVEVAKAVKRKTPVQIEALGNVTTMASVAVKPRIDDEIVGIHFNDGAFVKKGDLLVTLDPRTLEAQDRPGRRRSRPGPGRSSKGRNATSAAILELVGKGRDATSSTSTMRARPQADMLPGRHQGG